jgi:hypothetical protein
MRLTKAIGLVELTDLELGQVNGSYLPTIDSGGELHASIFGPPVAGEIGASYSSPSGSRFGGSVAMDGRGWNLGVGGSLTSKSGRTTITGSAFTDGHDWGVKATGVIRF